MFKFKRTEETQILTTKKTFMKTHIVQQTKHQLRHDINGKWFLNYNEFNGISQ